jgi:hypothetical protein
VANEDSSSPASIARKQADRGVPLVHPDMLDADVHWRSSRLFTAEELNFDNISAAIAWMETLAVRSDHELLRPSVLSLKRELELIVASERTTEHDRQFATEIAQWLTVWLQNPAIFPAWFALRQNATEFRERFRF